MPRYLYFIPELEWMMTEKADVKSFIRSVREELTKKDPLSEKLNVTRSIVQGTKGEIEFDNDYK